MRNLTFPVGDFTVKKVQIFQIFLLCSVIFLSGCSSTEKSNDEKTGEVYYTYGTRELVRKNYSEALQHFLKAEKLIPDSAKLHDNMGMTYYFKKRYDLAMKYLKKAHELDPEAPGIQNNIASLYFVLGKYSEAEKIYHKILKNLVYESQFRTYFNLGLINLRQGKLSKAEEFFKLSVKDKEDHCPAHFQLGKLAERNERYQIALEHYNDASKGACVSNAAPQIKQVEMYLKLRKYPQAKEKIIEVQGLFSEQKNLLQKTSELLNRTEYLLRKDESSSRNDILSENSIISENGVEF